MSEEKNRTEFRITRNVITKGKHFGYPDSNWIEAFIVCGITIFVVTHLPFTRIAMIVSLLVLIPFLMVIFVRGIHKHSFTRMLFAEIKFQLRKRNSHLRSPEYIVKESKYANKEGANESTAQIAWKKAKERLIDFADKYGDNEEIVGSADKEGTK